MKKAILLLAVAVLVAGCGMKVTVANGTDKTVDVQLFTQGGLRQMGDIPAGCEESERIRFDKELLPADLSITVDGGRPGFVNKAVRIPEDPPRALLVDIEPDEDLGRVIKVYDIKGNELPAK